MISNWLKKYYTKGSLSIEAAIVTSVFLFAVMSIIVFFNVISVQQNTKTCLENIARRMAQTIYYEEQLEEMGNELELAKEIEKIFKEKTELLDEDYKEELFDKINKTTLRVYVYGNFVKEMKETNKAFIVGGVAGLNFTKTEYDNETGELHIVLNYIIKVPHISEKIFYIPDCQHICVKVWNGSNLIRGQKTVYITKKGKVYHTSKDCAYLKLSINKTIYKNIGELRNDAGSRYKKCNLCKLDKYEDDMLVFITKHGKNYHSTLECRGISRSVIAVDKAKIGERTLCKKCGEGNE